MQKIKRSWRQAICVVGLCLTAGIVVADEVDEPKATAEESAQAEGAEESQAGQEVMIFDRMKVVGSASEALEIPGSAHYISATELEKLRYSDVQRMLRQVPGINIQEEDGYGLRPNIGMRGTGVERSQKITLMEDGVLIAPAPYAAPAAYYFPTAGRMEALEVLKGASAIRQGPYTNGGVLNMISSSIPSQLGGTLTGAAGEDSTLRLEGLVGDSRERWGWALQGYTLETDGFKELDGGGNTGFELDDYLGKFRINSEPGSGVFHSLDFKAGKTEQLGNETYLGLTEADFARNPLRRYAGSQLDQIDTDHEQFQLQHYAMPNERFDLTTTVYRNDFFRDWFKLETIAGVRASSVLADPASFANELAIARGAVNDTSGPLALRHNRRDYYSEGAQSVATWNWSPGEAEHKFRAGVRYHQDEEDRFQEEDRFNIVDGVMSLQQLGAPGSNANRISQAEALALFVEDRIAFGRWTLSPGVRFESIDFLRQDFGRSDPGRTGASLALRENGVDVWIPGFGVTFAATPEWILFAGVHKGFSPPGAGRNAETEAEESISTELGVRFQGSHLRGDLVAFFNDYDNLLGADTVSSGGGGTGELFNGGEVEVQGIEASLSTNLGPSGLSFELPLTLSYTYTQAEFQSSFTTSFADWAPQVQRGDELPYIPQNQLSLGLGFVADRWSGQISMSYGDEYRTRSGQGPIPAGEGVDSHLVVDLAANVRIVGKLELFAQLRNATDDVYVAARRPAGLRPGLPRTALVGLNWDF